MRLLDEIRRSVSAFDPPDEDALVCISSPGLRTILSERNGALALSGALVLFGLTGDKTNPLNFQRYRNWPGRSDYGLLESDEIFGADVFGDLLILRNEQVCRLDGETGEQVPLGELDALLNQDLDEVTLELGGLPAREHFGGRVIGTDPLRLLPIYPFMMREHEPGKFFQTPLTRALELKHRLFMGSRDVPNGAGVDCSFWRAE